MTCRASFCACGHLFLFLLGWELFLLNKKMSERTIPVLRSSYAVSSGSGGA